MRTQLFAVFVVLLSLIEGGCATGFRATGPRGGGVEAGAGIGQPANPVVVQENAYVPPPPPPLPVQTPPPEAFR